MTNQHPLSVPLWELLYMGILAQRHANSIELCHDDPTLCANIKRLAILSHRTVRDLVRYYDMSEREYEEALARAHQYDALQRGVDEPAPDPDAGVFA